MPTKKPKSPAPKAAAPTAKKTAAKKPAVKKPAAKKPVAPKPAAKKPAAKKPAAKKPVAKKPVAKKPVAKKPAAKKPAAKKPVAKKPAAKKPVAKKPVAPKPAAKKPVAKKIVVEKVVKEEEFAPTPEPRKITVKIQAFFDRQKGNLLALKDTLLDSMTGVTKDSLRSRADGGEASAFGMHQADAGSDAYDRDFALSLLSQEQDSLYEIDEALKRIKLGTFGICEISNKLIPHLRLEALPFTRYTVECQADLEKNNHRQRNFQPVTSLFGSTDDDRDDDDSSSDSKD